MGKTGGGRAQIILGFKTEEAGVAGFTMSQGKEHFFSVGSGNPVWDCTLGDKIGSGGDGGAGSGAGEGK